MADLVEQHEPIDMSAPAIAQRLRDLQQLYLFSMSLIRARVVDVAQPTGEMSSPAEQSTSKTKTHSL